MAKPRSEGPASHAGRDPWPRKRPPEGGGPQPASSERAASELDPPGASGLPGGTGPKTDVDYTTSTTSGRRSVGEGTGPGLSSGRGNKI